MKKIFLIIMAMLAFSTTSYAAENQKVNFLYVHGANLKSLQEFKNSVDKAHPYMIKNLEKNNFVANNMLKGATIDKNYNVLYWADKTYATKKNLQNALDMSKKYAPIVPQATKEAIANLLHDAIWIQKDVNSQPILNDLHQKVMDNYKNGEKTLLIGYSAGTFITYKYTMTRYRYLNMAELVDEYAKLYNFSNDEIKQLKKYSPKSTCISALLDADILVTNGAGMLKGSPDKNGRNKRIMNLKRQTELSCAPDDAVIGVLNIGSPLSIFFSEMMNAKSQAQVLTLNMIKYLIENDKFFLTINYGKDPFGIPMINPTYIGMEQWLNTNIKNGHGFVYNKMLHGGRNLAVAHAFYWTHPNKFTKEFAKAYEEGYNRFYETTKK